MSDGGMENKVPDSSQSASAKVSPRCLLVTMLVICCLGAFYLFVLRPIDLSVRRFPTAADAQQSQNLDQYVTNRLHLDDGTVTRHPPPRISWSAHRNSTTLFVYGVTDPAIQQDLLAAVRDWQATNRNMTTLAVRFYDHEHGSPLTNEPAVVPGGNRPPGKSFQEVLVTAASPDVLTGGQSDPSSPH